jgi:hypothetical protein
MTVIQRIFGFLNSQTIENTNIIVDERYLQKILKFPNNPTDVNKVVLALYNAISEKVDFNDRRALPPEIEVKIDFNNVVIYRPFIETNYSENGYFLDAAYEALDSDTPGRKKFFLSYIHMLYLKLLGDYMKANSGLNKIEVIKKNADNIIVEIVNSLLLRIANNPQSIEHISSESIEYNVMAIVCHAFVDCKVLENPNNQ